MNLIYYIKLLSINKIYKTKETMNNINNEPEFKYLTHINDKAPLIELRKAIKPILDINLFPHMTDHSITHSDRLIDIISNLITPIQSTNKKINNIELTILYYACYLHDIGMNYEKANEIFDFAELTNKSWQDISEREKKELIRKHHHEISAIIIEKRFSSGSQNIFKIPDEIINYIACICEAHCLDPSSEFFKYQELTKDGPNIRTAFIAGLLRFADILDESQERALIEKSKFLELDTNEQIHWFRHYYTEAITYDNNKMLIKIWFRFPKEKFEEYKNIIPLLHVPFIKNEFENQRKIFIENGFNWYIDEIIEQKPYGNLEVIPDNVLSAMLKELYKRSQNETINIINKVRPNIDYRFEKLKLNKSNISLPEYSREYCEIVYDLYDFGGRRSAWINLKELFNSIKKSQNDLIKFDIGLKLANLMIEDDVYFEAGIILNEIEPLTEQLDNSNENKIFFWKTKAKWANKIFSKDDALDAIKKVIELAPDQQSKELIISEYSEMTFLLGELDNNQYFFNETEKNDN